MPAGNAHLFYFIYALQNYHFPISTTLPSPFYTLGLFYETVIVPENQMRFYLLDRIKGNTDNNEEGRTTEVEGDVHFTRQNRRNHAHKRDIECADKRDPSQYLVDIFRRPFSRSYARYIAAVFFHVVRHIVRIKNNGGIKIAKKTIKPTYSTSWRKEPGVSI